MSGVEEEEEEEEEKIWAVVHEVEWHGSDCS
jgi:hypothetical protein